jgi:hypothetical protein
LGARGLQVDVVQGGPSDHIALSYLCHTSPPLVLLG